MGEEYPYNVSLIEKAHIQWVLRLSGMEGGTAIISKRQKKKANSAIVRDSMH